MHIQKKNILKQYNRKSICYKSSFFTLLTFFCLFYILLEDRMFSANNTYSSGTQSGSLSLGKKRGSKRIKSKGKGAEASKGKYIDYFKESDRHEDLWNYSNVPIKHISKGIDFAEGLSVNEYQILIKDLISKKYPNLRKESAVSKYFFRALAENIYSLDGYLSAGKYNSIVDARETYFKINSYIDTLNINSEIKKHLKELYVFVCIYMQKVNKSIKTLEKLKKIPQDSVLYELKNHQDSPLGDYTAGMTGENLYYICAAFYNKFTELPKEKQVEVLDQIYSFNPTLQIAPPIIGHYNFYHWLLNLLPFASKPQLMKYCLRGNIGWLILPKTIELN